MILSPTTASILSATTFADCPCAANVAAIKKNKAECKYFLHNQDLNPKVNLIIREECGNRVY